MRRFFLMLIIGFIVSAFSLNSVFAQSPYMKGDKIGQVGIGYGFAGIYGSASVPPISVGFQYGLEDKISIGGLIGYTSSSYDLGNWYGESYKWTYTYIIIGARGEYHFLESSDKMDGYAGATLGYAITSVSTPAGYYGGYSAGVSYMIFGAHVGLRYYLSPQIALFGEVGYGIGYITAGVAFKL